MIMYKLTNSSSIIRLADNATIPNDAANTDYQQYLEWSKTNAASPVDLPTLAQMNAPLLAQLMDIDLKTIRALRESDLVRIATLNAQAIAVRLLLK